MRALWALPLQLFVYRQLMYLVVIQSVVTALLGTRLKWHRMQRTGTADRAPAQRTVPTRSLASSDVTEDYGSHVADRPDDGSAGRREPTGRLARDRSRRTGQWAGRAIPGQAWHRRRPAADADPVTPAAGGRAATAASTAQPASARPDAVAEGAGRAAPRTGRPRRRRRPERRPPQGPLQRRRRRRAVAGPAGRPWSLLGSGGTYVWAETRLQRDVDLGALRGPPAAGQGHQLPDRGLRQPRRASPNGAAKDLHTGGRPAGRRTDSMILLHTGANGTTMVSLPRDSWVTVPGYTRPDDRQALRGRRRTS